MDITLCSAVGCPLGSSCKRKLESRSLMQSYSHFEFDLKTGTCEYFIPVESGVTDKTDYLPNLLIKYELQSKAEKSNVRD